MHILPKHDEKNDWEQMSVSCVVLTQDDDSELIEMALKLAYGNPYRSRKCDAS